MTRTALSATDIITRMIDRDDPALARRAVSMLRLDIDGAWPYLDDDQQDWLVDAGILPVGDVGSAAREVIEMEKMLASHGEMYTGICVRDEARGWIDHGFAADEADGWCDIGVWDAATAAELRDAGLTPDRAAAAAERIIEQYEEAGESSWMDPIYAACNGDLALAAIIAAAE
jgi:hypothetical protein